MFVVFAVAEILFCLALVHLLKRGIEIFVGVNARLQSENFDRFVRKSKVSLRKFQKSLIERKKRKDFEKFIDIFDFVTDIAEQIVAKFYRT